MEKIIKELLDSNFLNIKSLGISIIDKNLIFVTKNATFEKMFPNLNEFQVQEFSNNIHFGEGIFNFDEYFGKSLRISRI